MTIDEAIENARKNANAQKFLTCYQNAKDFAQLAQWLLELKSTRNRIQYLEAELARATGRAYAAEEKAGELKSGAFMLINRISQLIQD